MGTGPASPFGKPSAKEDAFEFVVPDAGGSRIPKGDSYIGKLVELTKGEAKSSGNPMFTWVFVITKGEYAGMEFKLFTALTPNAMWKVAETLAAFGIVGETGSKLSFSRSDVINRMVRMVIDDDTYNGRDTSKLQGVLPHPSGAGTKATGGTPTPKVKPPVEEEDEAPPEAEEPAAGEEEEIDLDTMDRTALKQFIVEQELEIKVVKSMSDDDIRTLIAAKMEELADEEETPPVEDEEEELPPPKSASGKAPSTLGKKK